MPSGLRSYRPTDPSGRRALFAGIGHERSEVAATAYFDPEWRLLGMRHRVGTATRVTLSIRTIVQDALGFDAAGVLLAHNHPGGDASPSPADLAQTRTLARGLETLGVQLVDHLIFAGDAVVSLRALGVL